MAGLAVALVVALPSQHALAQQQAVLTYHGDAGRSGNFVVPALTFDKARGLHLNSAFAARVDGHLYTQPLYWRAPGASTAMLLTASENDVVQAFDAATGKELWRRSVGPTGAAIIFAVRQYRSARHYRHAGDRSVLAGNLFRRGCRRRGRPAPRMFALSLKDGSVLPGWPVDVGDALQKAGKHFDPRTQNQRTALTLLDGMVYAGYSGHFGDCGDYHGWLVGFSLHDPGKIVSFETKARGGGIWAPGGFPVVGRDLFFATGNTFGARTWSDGEAVFRVPPDLRSSDSKRDFFAPSDWKSLDSSDEDLGGSNPIAVDVPGPSGSQAMLVALGKDGKAYLLDRNNLGGIGGQLAAQTVSNDAIRTSPAAYPLGNDMMLAFEGPGSQCPSSSRGEGLTVLKIHGGSPPTMTTAWCGAVNGRGSAIATTTDGRANPIVWMLGAEGDNRLHAFRGDSGAPIVASQPMSGLRHFQTLIATQDRLYVGADGRIYAFAF